MRLPYVFLYCKMIESKSTYKDSLDHEDRLQRDRHIPHPALKEFKYSSFRYLYISGNNQTLMNATSHDHNSFNLLLNKLKHSYDYNMMDERGYISTKDVDRLGMPMRLPH